MGNPPCPRPHEKCSEMSSFFSLPPLSKIKFSTLRYVGLQ
jgi:hypothetical protein